MGQPFKILKWLHILHFLWNSEDPGGYELFIFFARMWNFHLASHKNTQKTLCNIFQSPPPAIKGSAALIVYLLTHHIWISWNPARCQCSCSTDSSLFLYVPL